jgi:hypothetical protein
MFPRASHLEERTLRSHRTHLQCRIDYLIESERSLGEIHTFPLTKRLRLNEDIDLVTRDKKDDFPAPEDPMMVRKSPL